jgi:hypothetical protein
VSDQRLPPAEDPETTVELGGKTSDNVVDRRDVAWDVRFGPKNYAILVSAQTAGATLPAPRFSNSSALTRRPGALTV